MGIEAIPHKTGAGRAKIVCDDCARSEVIPCAYSGNANAASNAARPNESQARTKALQMGWASVKNKLRCPSCEAKRKATPEKPKEVEPMKAENVTPLRQPTPKQKREIIGILEDVYDDDQKRYRGHETDKTVAETIGGGVMPGWVAEIREDMFGPDGSNDEMEALLIEMREWRKGVQKEASNVRLHLENAEAILRDKLAEADKVAEYEKRIEAIVRSVGPKAGRA